MKKSYLIKSKYAKKIYKHICALPIIDYHCHLSPREIYEDRPFEDIGEMWLGADHYKWRLMRTAGIDEYYITGKAPYKEKLIKYIEALEFSPGNPLYHWSQMELSQFFNINTTLSSKTAEKIYAEANSYILKNRLSPRSLIESSGVEVICTTDDITDSLEYHKKLGEDKSFKAKVLPSFRTDNLLLVYNKNYRSYINRLSEVTGIEISNISALKNAVRDRLDYFCSNGCRFTDVGIPFFPDKIYSDADADGFFTAVINGENTEYSDYLGFIGNMYLFLAEEYKKRGLVMQLHLAVHRNANSKLFDENGADCGVDCVGDALNGRNLISLLDAVNSSCGMPETVIYTLNPANAEQIASIAGAFPGVRCGTAWWFCDHKRGIKKQIEIISENSSLGSFLGMLTDSRSFLSYARHDYFRRILSEMLGEWVDLGEYAAESALRLAEKICYYNVKELISK